MDKLIRITQETAEILARCEDEFRRHHSEFNQIPISYNKIVYETARIYLEVD